MKNDHRLSDTDGGSRRTDRISVGSEDCVHSISSVLRTVCAACLELSSYAVTFKTGRWLLFLMASCWPLSQFSHTRPTHLPAYCLRLLLGRRAEEETQIISKIWTHSEPRHERTVQKGSTSVSRSRNEQQFRQVPTCQIQDMSCPLHMRPPQSRYCHTGR